MLKGGNFAKIWKSVLQFLNSQGYKNQRKLEIANKACTLVFKIVWSASSIADLDYIYLHNAVSIK